MRIRIPGKNVISVLLIGIAVSFFVYPVTFSFFTAANTKIMLAVIGVLLFVYDCIRKKSAFVHYDLIGAFGYAVLFSLLCYIPVSKFGTEDDSYTTYYLSFLVWTFSAYAVCSFIRQRHGQVSLQRITYYLAAVAVAQCALSQLIDSFPGLQDLVDRIFNQDEQNLHGMKRLYGIGASLDSGGVRFCFTQILIAFFLSDNMRNGGTRKEFWLLLISFVSILIFGNMIARTTTVGTLIGVVYIVYQQLRQPTLNLKKKTFWTISSIILFGILVYMLMSYFYSQGSNMYNNLRFAFEGFFNLAETGEFQSDSFDKLNGTMWIWPTDTRTWIMGTGRFGNWAFGTDIGYCRFTLYCGLLGLSAFSLFFIHNAIAVSKKYKGCFLLAVMFLALVFAVWVKVSTDIYQVFALIYCADALVRDSEAEKIPE